MEEFKSILNDMLTKLGVDKLDTLDHELNLRDDLEIDSISYAELVVNLENKFNVNINSEGRAETLGDVITRLSL